jgi:hypothetical protein
VTDEIEVLRLFRDDMPGPSTDAWARARSAIAVARSEEEPAGRRRSRGPGRRLLLSVAAGVAVAAAVAGLLAALFPGSPVTGARGPAASAEQVRATAYVVTRAEHALALSGQDSVLGYARTVYPPGMSFEPVATGLHGQYRPDASSPWSVSSTVRWSYRGITKTSAFTAAGQRVFDERITFAHGGGSATVAVIYPAATWWRATIKAVPGAKPGSPRCGPRVMMGAGGWPAFIREELRCGEYTMDGRQRVDGVDAIKITGNKGLDTLWVNPVTYLPVRAIFTFGRVRMQTDFRWLSPTHARLARLGVPVPAGFRQVPPPS